MNLKELVNAISIENEIPAKTARKISVTVLAKLRDCIEKDLPLITPYVRMSIVNRPEKEILDKETGQNKTIKARKFGRISAVNPKSERN